ncbi:MAG: hypothetical protein J6Q60_06290 [Bacteroidaceae bacterium]|nr:hypothetical protein [Bacteroidaceae bacterium]
MRRKDFKWAVNIDKLRICFNMPENLYEYLHDHYSRYDKLNKSRILDEDDFNLVFFDEDENKMSAVLNVRDVEGFFRLGTFTFSASAKYQGKAFFAFENSALYRIYTKQLNSVHQNHICDLLYVAEFYGMTFNNVTELELAFDSTCNYINSIRTLIKDVENYDLYLNGRKVKDEEILDGYGEYYTRTRIKLSKLPTLYFSQAKKSDMKMRIYNKAKEIEESSPQKEEQVKEWLGWEDISKLYRVEVVLHNANIREFVERAEKQLLEEWGVHANILNLLCVPDFRLAMFLDSIDRLVYFRNKKTTEKISIVEVA